MGIYKKITNEIKKAELAKEKAAKQIVLTEGYIAGLKNTLKWIEKDLNNKIKK